MIGFIRFLLDKKLFLYLDNLHVRQKVRLWFNERQKFLCLFCLLPPVCHVPKTVLQIKRFRLTLSKHE